MADDNDQGPNPNPNPPAPRPVLPDAFKNRILEELHARGEIFDEGSLVFVVEKSLTESDVNPILHRLLIPSRANRFLNNDEKARPINIEHMFVTIIEPSLEMGSVRLAKWKITKNPNSYVLSTNWNEIVRRNNLTENQIVQLWAFRVGGDLWFALVRLPPPVMPRPRQVMPPPPPPSSRKRKDSLKFTIVPKRKRQEEGDGSGGNST